MGFDEGLLERGDLILLLLELAIADLCYTPIVTRALGTLGLELQALDLDLALLDLIDELLFTHPLGLIDRLLLLELGDLLIQLLELRLVILTADSFTLDLQLRDPSCQLIEILGEGVDLHT